MFNLFGRGGCHEMEHRGHHEGGCEWIIWILILLCLCGGQFGHIGRMFTGGNWEWI